MTQPEPAASPDVGATLGGRFVLREQLGEGGVSRVFLADDQQLGRRVALKLIVDRYKGRPEREQRILNEAEFLRRIGEAAHVVELVDGGRLEGHGGWPFVAIEILDGKTLAQQKFVARSEPVARVCQLARQIAEAVRTCHRHGVVHRDVTPANLMLIREGEGAIDRIKLFDFSHAAWSEGPRVPVGHPDRLTREHEVPGTPKHMSPEQARADPATPAMDVYAFGVVIWELITGENPFGQIRDRQEFIDMQRAGKLAQPKLMGWTYDIPEALAELVNACLEHDPGARPDMNEVVRRLDEVLAELRVRAPIESTQYSPDAAPAPVRPDATGRLPPEAVEQAQSKQRAAAVLGAWGPPPPGVGEEEQEEDDDGPTERRPFQPPKPAVEGEGDATAIRPFQPPASGQPNIDEAVTQPRLRPAAGDEAPTQRRPLRIVGESSDSAQEGAPDEAGDRPDPEVESSPAELDSEPKLAFARPPEQRGAATAAAEPPDASLTEADEASEAEEAQADPGERPRSRAPRLLVLALLIVALGLGGWAIAQQLGASDDDGRRLAANGEAENAGYELPEASEARAATSAPSPAVEPSPAAEDDESTGDEDETGGLGPSEVEAVEVVEPVKAEDEGGDDGAKPSSPQVTPEHEREECAKLRKRAQAALRGGNWTRAETSTRRRKCWSDQDARLRIRVQALAQSERFQDCVDAGADSQDKEIKRWVNICRRSLR